MMMRSRANKYINIFTYILSIFSSIVGIGLNFFLAKVLEADAYGRVQYLLSLSTLISCICVFGLNSFLIREVKNSEQKGNVFNKCFTLYLAIYLFVLPIIYFLLYNFVAITNLNRILSIFVTITAFLMGVNSLITAYFQGGGKYHLSVIFETLIPKMFLLVCAIVFMVIGNLKGFQENYLVFYIIIYSLIAIPIVVKTLKGLNLRFTRNELISIFFFFGVTVTYNLGNELTKVLQGSIFNNTVALATISVSTSILNLILVFTNVLNNLTKPIYSKFKREKNTTDLIQTYRFNTRINSYIAIPFYLFFIIFSNNFLQLFGESYTKYPMILTIMALASAVSAITGPNGSMLAMTGNEKYELFNGFIYFGTYIAMAFAFSFEPVYGLTIALLISQIVVNIFKYIECWKLFKMAPLDKKTIFTLLIIIITNCGLILPLMLIKNYFLWFGVGFVVGAALIVLNCFIFSLYRKNDFKHLLGLRL